MTTVKIWDFWLPNNAIGCSKTDSTSTITTYTLASRLRASWMEARVTMVARSRPASASLVSGGSDYQGSDAGFPAAFRVRIWPSPICFAIADLARNTPAR